MGSSQSSVPVLPDSQVERLEQLYDKQMEEEIVLKSMQQEQEEAITLARRREQLSWEVLGSSTTTIALLVAARLTQNKFLIVPMVPLIMGMGYRYEQCYGESSTSIRDRADKILKNELNILKLPGKEITLAELDSRRNVQIREINLP